ncbi:trichothecene 3-O-acetyltransferase [Coprinopsis sp. MPI-PUGE-AT-0042]|nr:trichothecene 3-O-acetyltransferase [Coprinopsis sp. MPI-PUGE-AT-0042]
MSSSGDLLNIELDILGQQPLLGIYTQLCQCFALHDDSPSDAEIVNRLTGGLERLASAFPWAAGQIVCEGASETSTGTFCIRPLAKTPPFMVKDLRGDPSAVTMDALRKADFPMGMLHESVIASRYTLPGGPNEDTNPVLLVQATFIQGGLILTFMGQHQAMDVVGLGELMHLLSMACHNESFTEEQMVTMNLPRHDAIPLLEESYDPTPDTDDQTLEPSTTNLNPSSAPKVIWANVVFSAQDLASLKTDATDTLPQGTKFISTDDATTAFIWQSIMRARLPRFEGLADARFARAVDVRPFLGMPKRYPGLYQLMTYHQYTLEELVKAPLGAVAAELRSALKADKLIHSTRALATQFARTPNKSMFSLTANIDPTRDIMLSSWAKEDCYSFDYSLGLGAPEAVRRPSFAPFESLAYLLPKKPNGEITVALSLREEDWERLRGDSEFTKYASYVG